MSHDDLAREKSQVLEKWRSHKINRRSAWFSTRSGTNVPSPGGANVVQSLTLVIGVLKG